MASGGAGVCCAVRLGAAGRVPEKEAGREGGSRSRGTCGRDVRAPVIFPAVKATVVERTGGSRLTNGLCRLLQERPIYACEVKGVRHDTVNKLGFLKAVVYFALRRPDLAEPFRKYLRENAGI